MLKHIRTSIIIVNSPTCNAILSDELKMRIRVSLLFSFIYRHPRTKKPGNGEGRKYPENLQGMTPRLVLRIREDFAGLIQVSLGGKAEIVGKH